MTEFPTGIGAVIRAQVDDEPDYFVRTATGWHNSVGVYWDEHYLNLLEIVQEGFVPPTEEPTGRGAVVEDARGGLFWGLMHRTDAKWYGVHGGFYYWREITQPVTVHFEGVE